MLSWPMPGLIHFWGICILCGTAAAGNAVDVSEDPPRDWGPDGADAIHTLPADDECMDSVDGKDGSSEGCAMSALQLRGRPLGQGAPAGLGQLGGQSSEGQRSAAKTSPDSMGQPPAPPGLPQTTTAPALEPKKLPGVAVPDELKPVWHGTVPGVGFRADQRGKDLAKWFGGGKVDNLPGQDQVDIMKARDNDWKMAGVVYQIFVDRFVKPKSLKAAKEYLKPPREVRNWSDPIRGGGQNDETKYYKAELDFYGGNLQGVQSKLDYVASWADIVYLQPIFEAYSVHKYDTTNYFKIDPSYGTQQDFENLKDAVHKKGMHLVLDGVFNHCGVRNELFKDALSNASSPYRNWFFIGKEYGPLGYKNWQNGGTLAEFRLEDWGIQKYIWHGNDSVVGHWLHAGADGWRLDVATEIGRQFLWQLTKDAHKLKYGSLVVGEVSAYPRWWTEATDGILSFWMGWIIQGVASGSLVGNIATAEIKNLIRVSSMEQLLRSWIIVSNHDTPRLVDLVPNATKREFVRTLQFVLPGVPCIYYGEELGMKASGGKPGETGDPYNRAPMQWDMVSDDNEIMNHTRFLVDLRRRKRALRVGDFHALMAFVLMAFLRRTDRIDELVIVLANAKSYEVDERLSLHVEDVLEYTPFRDVLTGEITRVHAGTIKIKMPPFTVRILEMAKESGPASDQYKRIYGHWDTFPDVVGGGGNLGDSVGAVIR